MSETLNKQLLHLVFGGELANLEEARFRNIDDLDIVGVFESYEAAEKAWRPRPRLRSIMPICAILLSTYTGFSTPTGTASWANGQITQGISDG